MFALPASSIEPRRLDAIAGRQGSRSIGCKLRRSVALTRPAAAAFVDVAAHGDRRRAVAPAQNRIFHADVDLADLRQRNFARRACRASVKSPSRAGSSRSAPALRATTSTERMSSRTWVTGMPVNRNCSCCAASLELSRMRCSRS